MCAAIIAYFPFIFVINKNRRPLLWSMTIQPVLGLYGLYLVKDNISKMRTKIYRIQIIPKFSPRWFDDSNCIKGLCLVMYNLLTPLARVRLTKHYTTKTKRYVQIIVYPGERDLTNIFRPNTKINRNNRLWPIYTNQVESPDVYRVHAQDAG